MTYTGIGYKKWALNCYDPYNMFLNNKFTKQKEAWRCPDGWN